MKNPKDNRPTYDKADFGTWAFYMAFACLMAAVWLTDGRILIGGIGA